MTIAQSALLIERAPLSLSLLGGILKDAGFTPIQRATALHEALSHTRMIAFDVAFVEVGADAEAGFDFLRQIRFNQCGPLRRLPVIGVCAEARRTLIERVRDAGAHGLVAMPFSRAAVLIQLARLRGPEREWIESSNFIGPDRRRWQDPRFAGPERRQAEDILHVA